MVKKNNKILILLTFLLLIFTGCAKNNPVAKADDNIDVSTATVTTTPKAKENLESEPAPTEEARFPILDEKLTEALTTYMYESFGGSGNDQLATSWFKYIDRWEVYQNKDSYSGTLYLKERPFDASARVILSKYYTDDQLDILCPILMDVGASLDLDDIDLCLIGEALYKINTTEDAAVHYYSLAALNIPIYDFLSEGFGESVSAVQSAIKKNKVSGTGAYLCLIDYMATTYEDAFDGLSMEKVKLMSMAAIANFSDVRIETLKVVDHDNESINTYKKLN